MAGGPGGALLSLIPTSTSLTASSASPVYGQSETFTAQVTTPSGDPTPTSTDGLVGFAADADTAGHRDARRGQWS